MQFELIIAVLVFISLAPIVFGLGYKVMSHITPITSVPVFAGLIFIELITSQLFNGKPPHFFRFNRPKTATGRFYHELIASIAITPVAAQLYVNSGHTLSPDQILYSLLPFPLALVFLAFYLAAWVTSCFCVIDEKDPMKKLKELGLPPFVKEKLLLE